LENIEARRSWASPTTLSIESTWRTTKQAFSFFSLKEFVRRLSEAGEQRITEFDGCGEPSYKLCSLNKTKALNC